MSELEVRTTPVVEDGLTLAVNRYFEGVYRADADLLRRAFDTEAKIIGTVNDQTMSLSLDDLIAKVTAMDSDVSKGLPMEKWITAIDVAGPHAVVRARVRTADMWFNDFLLLTHGAAGWSIRFKAFNDARANQPPIGWRSA